MRVSNTNATLDKCTQELVQETPAALSASESVPSVSLQLQLPVSKEAFLLQQDSFIAAIARTAGVNPNDVTVVSLTEVDTGGGVRRRMALQVVTQIRTSTPQVIQNKISLSSVNTALSDAGLPQVTEMRVEVVEAGDQEVSSRESSETDDDSPTSSVDFRLIVAGVTAGVGAIGVVGLAYFFWFRRQRSFASGKRVNSCDGCQTHLHLHGAQCAYGQDVLVHGNVHDIDIEGLQDRDARNPREVKPSWKATKVRDPHVKSSPGKQESRSTVTLQARDVPLTCLSPPSSKSKTVTPPSNTRNAWSPPPLPTASGNLSYATYKP